MLSMYSFNQIKRLHALSLTDIAYARFQFYMEEASSHVNHKAYGKAKRTLKLAEHNLRRAYNIACKYNSPLYCAIMSNFKECNFKFTNEKV